MAWDNESADGESDDGDAIQRGTGPPGSDRRRFGPPTWLRLPGQRLGGGDGPGWQLSRGVIVLATVALIAGLAAGYAAGRGASGSAAAPAPLPSVTPVARATPTAISTNPPEHRIVDGAAIEQFTELCYVHNGSRLQLGVAMTNQSAAAVTLTAVKPLFPGDAGALRELSWQWAPCGAITYGLHQRTIQVAPDSTAWLSVTFKVLVTCPAAYPVQFSVSYVTRGVPAATVLPGFPDLGTIPDPGCPAA